MRLLSSRYSLLISTALIAFTSPMAWAQDAKEPQPVMLQEGNAKTEQAASNTPAKAEKIDPLTQALANAYNYNPRLKAEREALKVVDEQVAVAVSGFRPNAEASYNKGRQRTSINSAPWFYSDTDTKELVVEQPLFNGGTTYADFKAAKARVKQARAKLASVEQQVLLDAVTAYADVLSRQSELELNRNNVDVLKKQLDATSARFNVGELTRTDVAQANARVAQSQANLRQAEANLKIAQASYGQIIGAAPSNLLSPVDLPTLPASLEEAVNEGMAANPDLMQAFFAEKAARQDVNARIGDILPDVSVQGAMSRTKGSRFLGGTSQYDGDSVTVNVSIPLYQSGAEYARVRAAKNNAQQARYETRQTSDAVIQNVTAAYENYQSSLSVIKSTEESAKASEVALTGVRQENEYGVRTILDVLDAEQELFSNQVNFVRAQRDKIVNSFALLAATGKLNAKALGLPVENYNPEEHYNGTWWKPIGF